MLWASVPTHKREAWYREQLKRGIDVVICHPKLVETGLDPLEFPTILFLKAPQAGQDQSQVGGIPGPCAASETAERVPRR